MRYTTLIDISEMPLLYRNINARLIYLHLILKAGYHDTDRDIVDISVRRLSSDVGISISATRHALKVLESAALLRYEGNAIIVKKWLVEDSITPRRQPKKSAKSVDLEDARQRQQQELNKQLQQTADFKARLESEGKTSFMLYYEGLMQRYQQGDTSVLTSLQRHRKTYESQKSQVNETLKSKVK